MFIHSQLSSSVLCEVASNIIRIFPLEYILVSATLVKPEDLESSVTRADDLNYVVGQPSVNYFFSRKEKRNIKT